MMRFEYVATLEDGTVFEVVADQRDVAKFETQTFGAGWFAAKVEKPFTFARFLAWHALHRTDRTKLTWDEWENRCVQVDGVEKPDEEDDSQDPGSPAASAGT